ncbi:MAG: ankyrin repeat domain-containing protein [Pseudomonadota bacterium]
MVLRKDKLAHIKTLVAAGVDPNTPDMWGMTPLHYAVWAGLEEYTAYFLGLDPDLEHVNGYGGDTFGTLIHGADNRLDTETRNHIACADLLFAVGVRPKPEDVRLIGYRPLAEHLEARLSELD